MSFDRRKSLHSFSKEYQKCKKNCQIKKDELDKHMQEYKNYF